jgi:hypothetical protein
MMTLYVQAKSKKALNEQIAIGRVPIGVNYSIFGDGGSHYLDHNLPDGTVIKVYEKLVSGSPYAKSYGVWDGKKVK